jgi:hypothetical protein
MAGKLKIPWCGVTDEVAKIAQKKTAADEFLIWPGSLEACFGLTGKKVTPAWQGSQC